MMGVCCLLPRRCKIMHGSLNDAERYDLGNKHIRKERKKQQAEKRQSLIEWMLRGTKHFTA